jgi:hypothetical protein
MVSKYMATVMTAPPMIGSALYRPVLVVTRPAISVVTVEQHQRDQHQAALGRRQALHRLLVQRQEGERAEHGQAEQEAHRGDEREVPVAEHMQRQHGLGRPPLDQDERDRRHHRHRAQHHDLHRPPRVLRAAPGGQQDQRGRGHGEDHRAKVVDLVLHLVARHVQGQGEVDEGGAADRHVDIEDPAPGQAVGDVPADQRAGDHGQRHRRHDVAHVLTALTGGHQVPDGRYRADQEPTGAEALQGAKHDELVHRVRQAGQRRADQEDDDRGHEQALAAIQVAQFAVQGRGHGGREHVGGDHPRQVRHAAQVTDDARQGGGDDELVEHGEHDGQQQTREDDHHFPPWPRRDGRSLRGRVLCHRSGSSPARCSLLTCRPVSICCQGQG